MVNKKRIKLSGWGKYPALVLDMFNIRSESHLKGLMPNIDSFITRGNGRSYGDSSLYLTCISNIQNNKILDFDNKTGIIRCESGVLFSEIIEIFVPKGWFLKVAPGTKLITVGGAIASDVHGKNHHKAGCFSESLIEIKMMLADGRTISCSQKENRELFLATCGGMGLTGVILEATFSLKKIQSKNIIQTTIKTKNLQETFNAFEKYDEATYSVAWIDCLSKGSAIGRSLLMIGEFSDDGDLEYSIKKKFSIRFNLPSILLNYFSVKLFNELYYFKARSGVSNKNVDMDNFFFPLDSIENWNRIYGRNGFVQYQFILPKKESFEGLSKILKKISNKGIGSFLAVLKLHSRENNNYLSFPMEGYSLALDFKIQKGLFSFLKELDHIILNHNGRVYLAKDSRVDKSIFEKGYPKINHFRKFRKSQGMIDKFKSLQSERLGL
jgi:decaprenylphospho-beta-D-ribofuranose 2-oxidase